MNLLLTKCRKWFRQVNLHDLRKPLVAVVGGSVTLVGLAMVVLPGPAILVIPLGLAILATEFPWAKRWLKRARDLFPKRQPQPRPGSKGDEKAWHHLPVPGIARLLEVNLSTGLSTAEVARRQIKSGPNRLTAPRANPAWRRFLRQFNEPFVYILLLAVGVTAVLQQWVDSSVIFGVLLVNAIVGFLQEDKAESAVAALAKLVATESNVRRQGLDVCVPSEALVPGDVVILQAGDRVPADLRLCHVRELQVDESTLTGEALPAGKSLAILELDTLLADRKNLVFAGTHITAGQAEGVVYAIGDQTETGRIGRHLTNAVELITPLTKKITQFGKLVLWIILALAAATFVLGVARGEKAEEMFMAAVAFAVGAIPEGLHAAVTIVLAIGVSRMAKRRAIIRHLPAVETLGSITVICADKTGTLTKNEMTVREIFAGGRHYELTGTGYEPMGEIRLEGRTANLAEQPALRECLRAGLLCNDSQVLVEAGQFHVRGDPTEAAMRVAAEKGGLSDGVTNGEAPRLDVLPFASEQMFRATLHRGRPGRVIYKVGALEKILASCQDALNEHNARIPLDPEAVRHAADRMAALGLRVLALASRPDDSPLAKLDITNLGEGFTFLGFQGMLDPPRPEAITAIRRCRQAGVAVKMITGDHLVTACAIARQMDLNKSLQPEPLAALSGNDLERVADADLPAVAERTVVFARMAPEQKLRLVRALQAHGHIVAMTGDGVNDAPALKQADIGIAMGRNGTEVAKEAADMLLTDDNFATIEAAVEEGRGIADNLAKFIAWTLPTNTGEALIILASILFGTVLPALPVQLLWVNMMSSLLLGLMLVFEPKEDALMSRPPRDPKRPLLTFPLVMRTGLVCLIMLAGAFWLFDWEIAMESATIAAARTSVINVIVLVEVGYLFSCRSLQHSLFAIGPFTNPWAIAGALAMIATQLFWTYAPIMNKIFHSAPIRAESWLRIVAVASFAFAVVELEKWVRFHPRRKQLPETGKLSLPNQG